MISVKRIFFQRNTSPSAQEERTRMHEFMELHAKCGHIERHLHYEKRHMQTRHAILSLLQAAGDPRSGKLQRQIAVKKEDIAEIKKTLHKMEKKMRRLARQVENTETYKKTLKKVERTYEIVSWIEKKNADNWLFGVSAGCTAIGIAFRTANHAFELLWQVCLPVFVSYIPIRFALDENLHLSKLKDKLDFLRKLPSFAMKKEHLKKETPKTLEYA